jgi:hypothetical protein
MLKLNLRKFLNSAVIDPNDKKQPILRTIIEEGTARHFELKAMEYIEEAARIRTRMEDSKRTGETLLEFYLEKLRLAATYLSLAAEKTNGRIRPQNPDKAGSKDPGRPGEVSQGT